jgi:hypothetical protein
VTTAAVIIRRRDPAVIAGRAHAVLDAAARIHAQQRRQWPAPARKAIGECLTALDGALEEYRAAGDGEREPAAEIAACAMALLLIAVELFLGPAVAQQMAENAAEVAR